MTKSSKKYDVKLNGNEGVLEEKLDSWYRQQNQIIKPKNGFNENVAPVEVKPDDDVIDLEWERQHLRYGWGRFTPDCLQVFNNIGWYVFWNCVFSLCQGFVVHGVINAVISTLEKRFELPSSKSGLIASSNDFLAFFLVLVISFYGSQRHKPRMIGIGVIVLGIGSIVFALPHFASGLYNYAGTDTGFENVCHMTNGTTECKIPEKTSSLQSYVYVFILANALHGAGSTPMFTLGTTFIDENSRAEQTPFFLGIIYCLASLGVAAGYMGGSQFLNIYTDVDRIDTRSVTITPMDPTWIGAWWIPFLMGGAIMFVVAVPLLGYPKRLPVYKLRIVKKCKGKTGRSHTLKTGYWDFPQVKNASDQPYHGINKHHHKQPSVNYSTESTVGSLKLQAERKSETAKSKADSLVQSDGFGKSWRDFPKAIWNLLLNPTYVFLCLSGCAEGMIISGVATFGAKFLQEKFNLHPAFAGFIMGIITVPGAGGGMLLGGFIVKKMKLKCRGIIRMNLIAAVIGLVLSFTFLLQCPKQSIAGVTTEYISDIDREGPTDLSSSCNAGCGCSALIYEPVCGDGVIYFTPCHAGCSDNFTFLEGPMGPFKMYTDCECVSESRTFKFMQSQSSQDNFSTTTQFPTTSLSFLLDSTEGLKAMGPPPPGAYQGICMSDCKLLYAVAPLLFLGMLITFMTCSPTQTATMRCVPGNQRSLAIGLQWLLLRLLGTTPGPLMLGTIMDSACQTWQDLCGVTGSCWIYQKTGMGVKLFIWWCCVKVVCIIFYFLAQYLYVHPDKEADGGENAELSNPVEEVECRESSI